METVETQISNGGAGLATGSTPPQRRAVAPARHVHSHAVQFYEDDGFLAQTVAEFLREALARRQPALIIATPVHRALFVAALAAKGLDAEAARATGQLVVLDAQHTLGKFMHGDRPSPARFRAVVGGLIETSRAGSPTAAVHAYGEMVDVLWAAGNQTGALELEELWNDLAHTHRFSLLCAYHMANFSNASDAERFEAICAEHTRVSPTEHYATADADARLREITILQQRALSLESELAHRAALEQELRDTVGALATSAAEHRAARDDAERSHAEALTARRAAEQASRAKSEFLAIMSHELRTPLNAIGGYAELMELGVHGPITAAQREALDRIQRSQRLLLGLVNQVLNYARVETGNISFVPTEVRLDDVLRAAEGLVAPQFRAKGLRYTYGGCDTALYIMVDEEKLQQILLNLMTNALKFTDAGGAVELRVEAHADRVELVVRDTGMGIAPDKFDAIFDPFVQVDVNYTRTRDGVGLGLAISRDLARRMGGDLTVASTPDVGSSFTLTIPRAT